MVDSNLIKGNKSTSMLRQRLIKCFEASGELIQGAVANYEGQEERTMEVRIDLSRRLLSIIDELLAYDDWGQSPFLTQLLKPTREMRESLVAFLGEQEVIKQRHGWRMPDCAASGREVYVLLYQANGSDMQAWADQLTDLMRTIMSRPIYGQRSHVEKVIRLRGYPDTDAYAVVHIDELHIQDNPSLEKKDKWGQPLVRLKDILTGVEYIKAVIYQDATYELKDGCLVQVQVDDKKEVGE